MLFYLFNLRHKGNFFFMKVIKEIIEIVDHWRKAFNCIDSD
jgi:hypothetical protein